VAFALVLFLAPVSATAEDPPSVAGSVAGDRGPLSGAHVIVQGTVVRAVADENGNFQLPTLKPGEYVVQARAVGFTMAEATVAVARNKTAELDFQLEPMLVRLDAITITGTMKEAFVSESPVTVKVVPIERLERIGSSNLVESLEHVNGLYQQVDCAVCGTNNVRVNGLQGIHTAFLIDGMPIMGALASVYGLNGLHPGMVEQIEVVKGPSSTLYGSEALAGVINVITKDPRFAPRLSLNTYASSHQEFNGDVAVAGGNDRTYGLASASLSYSDHFVDNIHDGYNDVPTGTRAYFFGKLDRYGTNKKRFSLAGRYYHEGRVSGEEGFSSSIRGSDQLYGESVYTNRAEIIGSYRPPTPEENLVFQFSYAFHDQDAYYGDAPYGAKQHVGYLNTVWDRPIGLQNDFLLGATLRFDGYDDNTPATQEGDYRFTPGIFAQNEYHANDDVSLLGGLRVDHHNEHGAIFSPRIAIKWEVFPMTTLRLNGGTGFRVIHIFTEDYSAISRKRDLIIDEDLQPERTRNATLNVNQVLEIGHSSMMIDFDAFYTYFTNRIVHDFDIDPDEIHYYNVVGHSISRGVGIALNHVFEHSPFEYSLGFTLQDVYNMNSGVKEDDYFAADWMAVWSASYSIAGRLDLDYSGKGVGPMRMPEYPAPFEKPLRSPVHTVHDIQAQYSVRPGLDLYAGVKNLFNYTQVSPMTDPTNPFGDSFDTAYVYGPMQTRRLIVGMRYAHGR
jgi:outer membrane receptor for ferrienterochelin and colicins